MTSEGSHDATVAPGVLRVLEVARGVLSDLDLDSLLERVVEAAREVSGAGYAALGVVDESRSGLERFITAGIDAETRLRIGDLPRGRGVLGELIERPETLRLDDVGAHPHSFGFPVEHPPMKTFLGVPVFVGERPFGNLYLTEKAGGEPFSEVDAQMVELLAQFAGVAIDHARRYSVVDARRTELQHTVDTLDATVQIAQALGGQTDLNAILELVAKRGRALVSARALVIEQVDRGRMVIAAGAGELPAGLVGQHVDLDDSLASAALRTLRTLRLEDAPNRARFERHGLGRLGVGASAGLIVPLLFRGNAYGVLIALDRVGGPAFTTAQQRLLEAFAASAATALATAEWVEAERGRQRLAAAEQERTRWARELHDETLQNLASLRLGLAAQLKQPTLEPTIVAVKDAVAQLEEEMATLRSLITELRPAALDDLGSEAAIRDLADRARGRGLEVDLAIDLAYEQGRLPDRHTIELETALYRIVQEALTNAVKHGGARRAVIEIQEDHDTVRVTVRDDGRGFDTAAQTSGFGLLGMRERVELLRGTIEVESSPQRGTTVTATLPPLRSHAQTA
ncbi:MAG TPA: GAF domain-containing sensor histidine kinase [Solirubrobacteraceae bacterium]|nr:GAF domain-containing sensor histidine kinase [Solirubrobacteraceae bacterium]